MNNKNTVNLGVSAVSFALFIILIILVKAVDVAAIGPAGTMIGLSSINQSVHNLTGVNMTCYNITKYLGLFTILVAVSMLIFGLYQLISRRSLAKVDREIMVTGILYTVVIALYVLFEVVIINYRPIVMPGDQAPEASFPSTHTMIACVVMGSIVMLTGVYIKNKSALLILRLLCVAIILITVIGRLLSGVHWFTDIIGGVLISVSLLSLYSSLIRK